MAEKARPGHIVLTSHPPGNGNGAPPIAWGAAGAAARGPVVGGLANPEKRNVIGAHSGSYALYRALAVAARQLDPFHVPDLTDTAPAAERRRRRSARMRNGATGPRSSRSTPMATW